MVQVSVQGRFVDRTQWIELATATDRLGFDCLYVADHPGSSAAPFVALAAAAVVTERVRLGTCVLNAGHWEPLALASQLATLDAISAGRAVFGVGAGHTPSEWAMVGSDFPQAAQRVERMIELVGAVRILLAGETLTTSGTHIRLHEANISEPHPVQESIPLMVGGNGRRVLAFAGECAEIVGVTGLGKTLPDGHSHEVEWGSAALDATFDVIGSAARRTGRRPDIEALVQHVEITDEPRRAAEGIADLIPGASATDLLGAPFIWIGTPDRIVTQIEEAERRWGINRYVIRDTAIDAANAVLPVLRAAI
jgi:probable F420-dependent oxidoreductase